MPHFGEVSNSRLITCDGRLNDLARYVVKHVDCSVLCGHRTMEEQNALSDEVTKVQWPDSFHNSLPSMAVDLARYPIEWGDRERQTMFAGFVMGVAAKMKFDIIWGGDWNRDFNVADNTFDDLIHFQLMENLQ